MSHSCSEDDIMGHLKQVLTKNQWATHIKNYNGGHGLQFRQGNMFISLHLLAVVDSSLLELRFLSQYNTRVDSIDPTKKFMTSYQYFEILKEGDATTSLLVHQIIEKINNITKNWSK